MSAIPGFKFGVAWMLRPNAGAYYWQQADVVYWGDGLNTDSPLPEYENVMQRLTPLVLNQNQVFSLNSPNFIEFAKLNFKTIPTAFGRPKPGVLDLDTDWYVNQDGTRVFSVIVTFTPDDKQDLKDLDFEMGYGPMTKDFFHAYTVSVGESLD